jgi:hypothetical protein
MDRSPREAGFFFSKFTNIRAHCLDSLQRAGQDHLTRVPVGYGAMEGAKRRHTYKNFLLRCKMDCIAQKNGAQATKHDK